LTHAQAARQRFESLVAADPLNSRKRQNLALAFSVESHALFANGDGPAALRALERAVNAAETLLAGEPTNQGNQITVMLNHYELGTGLIRVGRTAHGAARLRQAIAEAEAILRVSPRNNFMRSQLAAAKLDLGKALIAADPSSAEGCRQVTEGLEIWARARTRVPEELASQRARFEPIVARCRPR
jgi:tetratricopeptide (TPR) repeat protein